LDGSQLLDEVALLSAGRARTQAGTLFAIRDRLGAPGLVTLDRDEIVDGHIGRFYRLTPEGGIVLNAATPLRSGSTVKGARRVLRGQNA
jgi:PadR family transcriptional regulator PadR